MYQTVLFKAFGRHSNSPLVSVNALSLRKSLTYIRQAGRYIFSQRTSMAVAIVAIYAMWWHIVSIADTTAAGRQVAIDSLCAMPWGIVWAIRFTIAGYKAIEKEGGDK